MIIVIPVAMNRIICPWLVMTLIIVLGRLESIRLSLLRLLLLVPMLRCPQLI